METGKKYFFFLMNRKIPVGFLDIRIVLYISITKIYFTCIKQST